LTITLGAETNKAPSGSAELLELLKRNPGDAGISDE
jgi:hypothetical protein